MWMEALTDVQLHLLLSVNPENLVFTFGNFKNFLSEMEDFITFLSTALLFKSDCAVALADQTEWESVVRDVAQMCRNE